jgi:hypothetical protein
MSINGGNKSLLCVWIVVVALAGIGYADNGTPPGSTREQEEPALATPSDSIESLSEKAEGEMKWGLSKRLEQLAIAKSMISSGRYKDIGKVKQLADEVFTRAMAHRDRMRAFKAMNESYGYSMESNVAESLATTAAEMYIEAAQNQVRAKRYEDAKETYRMVIITFVGNDFKTYVKQAEFGLEDLKEMQKTKKDKRK